MASEREYIELVAQVNGDRELRKLGGIFEELMAKAKEAGVDVDKFAQELKELGNIPRQDMGVYDQFIGKLKTIAGISAIGMGIRKSVTIFTSFDDVMRKVQATTGATAEDMALLRFQAKELGETTRFHASEAAEAQFEFAKAGFNNNEILAATPGILNTAIAAQVGLAEATEITAGTLRMFKLDASKAGQVGDILAQTANSTSTDVLGLGESLKYAGKDAHDFKMSLEQTAAILGTLGNEMLKDSSAGTGLQAVFSAFKDTNKAKILVEAGINLSQDGEYRSFLDIMKDIRKKSETISPVEMSSLVDKVFGEQGSRVINRLLGQTDEEIQALIKELEKSSGSAKKVADIYEQGIGGAFRTLGSSAEGLGISFGNYLEPAVITLVYGITEVVRAGTGFIDWLNSGSYAADALSFAIVSLCVGYGTYKAYLIWVTLLEKLHKTEIYKKITAMSLSEVATLGLAKAKKLLAIAYATATFSGGAFTGTLAVMKGLMFSLTGPVGLIIAGITGVGAGFIFLYQKSERFRNAISSLINGLKELYNWVKKFDIVGGTINLVKAGMGKVKDFFTAGSQEKTADELHAEIDKRKREVAAGSGKTPDEVKTGTGVNTDYLLLGGGATQNAERYKHNGYYLKGTKNISNTYNSSTLNNAVENYNNSISNNTSDNYNFSNDTSNNKNYTNSNIYSEYTSTENKVPEKTMEEKILDTLLSIKELLSNKNSDSSKVNINITKNDKEEIISQVVDDLVVALGNM